LLILAELLEKNPGDTMTEVQVEYASVIRSSGNDLLTLLNRILDLAKAESGTIVAEKRDVLVSDLRAGLMREFSLVADGKKLGYSVDIAGDCPTQIVTDPERLLQIVHNLLSNAFKFTEQGHVKVRIGLARGGWNSEQAGLSAAQSVLALSVIDTGIGIESQMQARIFEAFAQGDGSTARLYGGTGLGLSISRELATLLGGELTVTSSAGTGSTFTLYLPLGAVGMAESKDAVPIVARSEPVSASTGEGAVVTPSDPPPIARDSVNTPPATRRDQRRSYSLEESAFGGARVFVVDDDFRNVFAMKALLERGNAIVTFAESGSDAIDMVKDGPDVDIILMDIMMPAMDGYATIRAIRKLERGKELPIIAVTGKVMAGERQRCLDAGANDYVPKPVDTGELVAAISPWLPTLVAAVKPWVPALAKTAR
jgi:CheY-like chemotaxis protein